VASVNIKYLPTYSAEKIAGKKRGRR